MKRLLLALALMLIPLGLQAQYNLSTGGFIYTVNVRELPANARWGDRIYRVADGLTASDCDRVSGGGGSHKHLCSYNATSGLWEATESAASAGTTTGQISFTVGDGANEITAGTKPILVEAYYAGEIVNVKLWADQSCSIVMDVWKGTAAVPTNSNSITASAKPTLSSEATYSDSTLTGWTTTFAKGDIFKFEVESVTTCTQVLLTMETTK